jgi:hypothetical protein
MQPTGVLQMSTRDYLGGVTVKTKHVKGFSRRSRIRQLVAIAVAASVFSIVVVAVTIAEPRVVAAASKRSNAASEAEVFRVPSGRIDDWPAPNAPFDNTPITPVESAGAPMFP